MIVAFIPEGLLPTVTLSLAMAVQRMARTMLWLRNCLRLRRWGATSVICSDKTGTLTQNAMTVNHLWTLSDSYEVTGLGYASEGQIEQEGRPISLEDNELLIVWYDSLIWLVMLKLWPLVLIIPILQF